MDSAWGSHGVLHAGKLQGCLRVMGRQADRIGSGDFRVGSVHEVFEITHGSGQNVLKISQVGSGRLHNLTGRVGSSQDVFKYHGSGRVGFKISWVGSGRVWSGRVQNLTGRVGPGRFQNLTSRVGSGKDVFKISRVESGRVESGRFQISLGRVGSGREVLQISRGGSGQVGSRGVEKKLASRVEPVARLDRRRLT